MKVKKKHTKKMKRLIMDKNHLWKNTKSTMEKHDYWIFPTRIFQINMCVGVINVFEYKNIEHKERENHEPI